MSIRGVGGPRVPEDAFSQGAAADAASLKESQSGRKATAPKAGTIDALTPREQTRVRAAVIAADNKKFPSLVGAADRDYIKIEAAKKTAKGLEVTLVNTRASFPIGRPAGPQGDVADTRRTWLLKSNGQVELVKPPKSERIGTATPPRPFTLPAKARDAVFADDAARFPALGNKPDLQYVAVTNVKPEPGGGFLATLATHRTSIAGPIPGHSGVIEGSERTYRVSTDGKKVELVDGPEVGGVKPKPKKEKTGAELAAQVERMLKGKVTDRERQKMREIATSVPIVMGHANPRDPGLYAPKHVLDRAKAFGDMVLKLREDKKLYDFLINVADMQLERYPPIPAGPTIDHVRQTLGRYGQTEALKAFEASMKLPDDWPWDRNQR